MKSLLLLMAENIKGVNEEIALDLDALKKKGPPSICDVLNNLSTQDGWTLLGLFSPDLDVVGEYSSASLDIDGRIYTLFVNLGLKWSRSELPGTFCATLDGDRYGWAMSVAMEFEEYFDIKTRDGEISYGKGSFVKPVNQFAELYSDVSNRLGGQGASLADAAIMAIASEGVPKTALEWFERSHKEPELREPWENYGNNISAELGVGDIVLFGERDWCIVDEREGAKLLVSCEVVAEEAAYHHTVQDDGITWSKCSLREWLNGPYIESCFNPDEQEAIIATSIRNAGNERFGIPKSEETTDRVFLLSKEEAERYIPTLNSVKRAEYDEVSLSSWLRTPGESSSHVMYVYFDEFWEDGVFADNREGVEGCVQPAMWVRV